MLQACSNLSRQDHHNYSAWEGLTNAISDLQLISWKLHQAVPKGDSIKLIEISDSIKLIEISDAEKLILLKQVESAQQKSAPS